MKHDLHGLTPESIEAMEREAQSVNRGPSAIETRDEAARAIAETIVTRGQSIYDEKIRDKVEETERGKFAVIDVYSEDYEIDARHADASRRLVARHPGAITYAVRIGQPTAYKFGFRSRFRTS